MVPGCVDLMSRHSGQSRNPQYQPEKRLVAEISCESQFDIVDLGFVRNFSTSGRDIGERKQVKRRHFLLSYVWGVLFGHQTHV